jgi:glycosyltransferase involved in cell wall biosynthesis
VPPLVANHSGLAEVGAGIAAEYPPEHAHLTTFPNGDADVLRERLRELLALPERRELGLAARRAVERNWSWSRVAERLLR